MTNKLCCWCPEELDRENENFFSLIDGSEGHLSCVEKYDEKLKKDYVLEDSYLPPVCENCYEKLVVSTVISREFGYIVNEVGEKDIPQTILNREVKTKKQKLHCQSCNSYYKLKKDDKNRIIRGKKK